MRILIADDHEIVRHGLRGLVQTHPGWEVCGEAATGVEAVERARQLGPDLAILDFAMPLLNGLQATREIRSALPAVDVLLFTVHESEHLAAEALQAGARGCVLKSRSAGELIAAIESVCRHPGAAVAEEGPAAGARKTIRTLTARQREIVHLVVDGKSNEEIGGLLGISPRTVETHRAHIMRRLGLRSAVQLVRYAIHHCIVGG